MDNATTSKWNELHTQARFRLKYPAESIVQFVFRNFKRDNTEKVLDLGCGAGRHVVFLASEGIGEGLYGTDISKEGIAYSNLLLEQKGLKASLSVAPSNNLPYEDNFFDGIICFGVLCYMDITDVKKSVEEINRTLKPGGKGFVMVRSVEDYRFGQGEEIEKNTFRLSTDTLDGQVSASAESGMVMTFFTKEELLTLFNAFKNVRIDESIVTTDNGEYRNVDFLIQFEK
ncbi:MAG: class I SAM-dependent methyltransferase [Defluviitaleaceae bacterium]|nr:class I SAM-dependent methyltransferase [Defluviitaleaceae bacterium]